MTRDTEQSSNKNTAQKSRQDYIRILLAEDSPDARQLMKAALERVGYEVDAVETGQQCRDKFIQSEYDMIILDFVIPDGNGLDLLREIRQHRPPEELPVIIVTAKQIKELVTVARKNGANDFFVKPIKISQFAQRVSNHLLEFTENDLRKALLSMNVPDITGLSAKLLRALPTYLNAFPFEHHGVKCCALIKNGKNPHLIAKKPVDEIEREVTIFGKGGFMWNIVWPRHAESNLDILRESLLEDDQFSAFMENNR